jgi:hypothetical protein
MDRSDLLGEVLLSRAGTWLQKREGQQEWKSFHRGLGSYRRQITKKVLRHISPEDAADPDLRQRGVADVELLPVVKVELLDRVGEAGMNV